MSMIEGLRVAMLGTTDGDFIDPDSDIPAGEMFRLAAEYIEDTLKSLSAHYPLDLWPEVTPEQMAALHDFARTLGMQDGSRFHVGGIRHALKLLGATSQGADLG